MATSLYRPRTLALSKIANLTRYNHPANLTAEFVKPVSQQLQQLNGKLEFGKGLYHSPLYQNLMKSVVGSRKQFRTTPSQQTRIKISTNEFQFWEEYLKQGVQELPESKRVSETQRQQLFQVYTIAKERQQESIACHRMLLFHNEYAKAYKMDIEIHPLLLMKLVHPHFGYLCYFKKNLTLNRLIATYNELLFASQEKYAGQSLHADELTALIFWKTYTDKPFMTVTQFCDFLKCFKFKVEAANFRQQFAYSLKNELSGQLNEQHPIQSNVIRFDFFRHIFLERGL